MKVWATLEAQAMAAGACVPAAAVGMEMLLGTLALVVKRMVEVIEQFALSNYAASYPNENVRSVDQHYDGRAAGSNSYYS